MAAVYGSIIHSSLDHSPFYRSSLASSSRLANVSLIVTATVGLLVLAFLYDNFRFSTDIAQDRLPTLAFGQLMTLTVVIKALGRLTVLKKE